MRVTGGGEVSDGSVRSGPGQGYISIRNSDLGLGDVDLGLCFCELVDQALRPRFGSVLPIKDTWAALSIHRASTRNMWIVHFLPELIEILRQQGGDDIKVIAGGVIPSKDYQALYDAGVALVFGPGTKLAEAAIEILGGE